jgi:hypothetical protein
MYNIIMRAFVNIIHEGRAGKMLVILCNRSYTKVPVKEIELKYLDKNY